MKIFAAHHSQPQNESVEPIIAMNQHQDKILKSLHRKGIYFGESSRSLFERAKEHMTDASSFSDKSHIIKLEGNTSWSKEHPSIQVQGSEWI